METAKPRFLSCARIEVGESSRWNMGPFRPIVINLEGENYTKREEYNFLGLCLEIFLFWHVYHIGRQPRIMLDRLIYILRQFAPNPNFASALVSQVGYSLRTLRRQLKLCKEDRGM